MVQKKENNTHMYRVGRAQTGCGLFANKYIKKEEFIIEYTGEALTYEQANERGGRYLFTLNDTTVLDGRNHCHTARYLNHSCAPNTEAVIEDEEHIMFYALRDIKKGEELTFDYGEEYFEDYFSNGRCLCQKCLSQKQKNNK